MITIDLTLPIIFPSSGHADIEDDLSCICGLNKELLDKLESIILLSSQSSCSNNAQSSGTSKVPLELSDGNSTTQLSQLNPTSAGNKDPQDKSDESSAPGAITTQGSESSIMPPHSSESSAKPPSGGAQGSVNENIMLVIAKLTSEVQRLEAQIQLQNSKTTENINNLPSIPVSSQSQQISRPSSMPSQSTANLDISKPINSISTNNGTSGPIIATDFLTGLQKVPINWNNEALAKLNQSQSVKPEDMASALESTVPNVVSNIFFNIQNLTTEAEQNLHNNTSDRLDPNSGKLTSIDGSSISVIGDSSAQITAQGEKLFLLWIEHQIESLHLTASAASYIRKSALSLFRRIAKQYVERIQRIGGSVEQNVQRATQMALNNSQNLVSFIIRNYMNFAGGMMQIIGEQVSRIGKQLDSTGETIAHISLNPFDIVSNVMESLPNPSEYAKYFRAFGKQLIGEISSFASAGLQNNNGELVQQTGEIKQTNPTPVNPSLATPEASNKNEHTITNNHRPQGLISSLGKTFSSWMG